MGKRRFSGAMSPSAPILEGMTERIISPDGTQFWDGAAWQPLADSLDQATAATVPAAPGTYPPGAYPPGPYAMHAHAPSPYPAGPYPAGPYPPGHYPPGAYPQPAAWSGGHPTQAYGTPPATGPVPQPAGAPDNSWAANQWAWAIALSPLSYAAVALLTWDQADVVFWLAGFAIVVAATIACGLDVRALRKRGVPADAAFTLLMMVFYLIGAPAYLIYRSRKAGTSPAPPITWFATTAAVAIAFVLTVPGAAPSDPAPVYDTLDTPVIASEGELESSLKDEFASDGVNAIINCPSGASYAWGSRVVCEAMPMGDSYVKVVVNIRNDGRYTWRVR